MYQQITSFLLSLALLLSGCSGRPAAGPVPPGPGGEASAPVRDENLSGTIPDELEYVPEGYTRPADHPGTLERLEYQTWESFSYAEKTQRLTKTAWVYLPCGCDADRQYNILYLSHGGRSSETIT